MTESASTDDDTQRFDYAFHLQLDKLLDVMRSVTSHPEEHIFLTTHHVLELWFKHVIHDLHRIVALLDADDIAQADWLMRRIGKILKLAEARWTVLETMSDADFAEFRERFHRPEGVIFLDGNSLGVMPRTVPDRLATVAQQEWSEGIIRSWEDAGWFPLTMTVGDRIALSIGAGAGQVAAGHTTLVNLFKALVAALSLKPDRKTNLTEGGHYPTDNYIATVRLNHVDCRTARIRDLAAVTSAVQATGPVVLWDRRISPEPFTAIFWVHRWIWQSIAPIITLTEDRARQLTYGVIPAMWRRCKRRSPDGWGTPTPSHLPASMNPRWARTIHDAFWLRTAVFAL